MKTASVRDLRYDFAKIERLLSEGEPIQITKRQRVIARLTPESLQTRRELPDFRGRMRALFGDKVLEVTGAKTIRRDRDRCPAVTRANDSANDSNVASGDTKGTTDAASRMQVDGQIMSGSPPD